MIELPLDARFEIRAQAAHRLWRALSGRSPCPPLTELPPQRRQRLALGLARAGCAQRGQSYRAIAEGLFGQKRIPERAWKTHDLRNRTIRLVQRGLALMRGGYRELLASKTQGQIGSIRGIENPPLDLRHPPSRAAPP